VTPCGVVDHQQRYRAAGYSHLSSVEKAEGVELGTDYRGMDPDRMNEARSRAVPSFPWLNLSLPGTAYSSVLKMETESSSVWNAGNSPPAYTASHWGRRQVEFNETEHTAFSSSCTMRCPLHKALDTQSPLPGRTWDTANTTKVTETRNGPDYIFTNVYQFTVLKFTVYSETANITPHSKYVNLLPT
jgi:hypothetical protein